MTRYTAGDAALVGKTVKVYLDGEELSDVFEADDKLGFAVVGVRENGKFVLDGDGIKRHLVTGKVDVAFG